MEYEKNLTKSEIECYLGKLSRKKEQIQKIAKYCEALSEQFDDEIDAHDSCISFRLDTHRLPTTEDLQKLGLGLKHESGEE